LGAEKLIERFLLAIRSEPQGLAGLQVVDHGELILQRVHPNDVDLLKNVLERATQGGSDFDFEHRLLVPDGSIKHIYNLSHCLRDKACNEEVVGAIMDVTERKLAEEAIRRSEAYLAEAKD
jgi:PAS domain-containing protein